MAGLEAMSDSKAKEKAKERDNYTCRFCDMDNSQHKEEFGRGIHAHHIVKDADGGIDHPQNLITVCRNCHKTLEKTQADALSRIKSNHSDGDSEEKEKRIKALEADLRKERNRSEEVFAWLENGQFNVHVLLMGGFDPDVTTFNNRETAAEAYSEYDGTCKLFTVGAKMEEPLRENFRYKSESEVNIRFRGAASGYFEQGESVDEEYYSADIPEEIKE